MDLLKDLPIGTEINRLTVMSDPYTKSHSSHKNLYVLCQCECGNLTEHQISQLRSGRIKSCGCYRQEQCRKINLSHGLYRKNKVFHSIWVSMIERCIVVHRI